MILRRLSQSLKDQNWTAIVIEFVLLVVGVCLIGFLQRFDVAAGVGAGLVLQAAFTLALDMFAEARGQDYITALKGLVT